MKIKELLSQFKSKFAFTLFLILGEASIGLLFPLFIGFAIDGAIKGETWGAIQLGILGLAALIVGAGRRFYDSRFYAQVFRQIGSKVISNIKEDDPSKKTARLSMIREMVEFMENSLPELIANVIGLVGVVIIIATLNFNVFIGGVIATILIFAVYALTSKKTISLNKSYNDELENQVNAVSKNKDLHLDKHLEDIMKWNIKLSDLEAANFSVAWLILMAFLVISIVISVGDGNVQYGALFALIMYVFQYMENVSMLPLFYQNWLRLTEIKERLEQL